MMRCTQLAALLSCCLYLIFQINDYNDSAKREILSEGNDIVFLDMHYDVVNDHNIEVADAISKGIVSADFKIANQNLSIKVCPSQKKDQFIDAIDIHKLAYKKDPTRVIKLMGDGISWTDVGGVIETEYIEGCTAMMFAEEQRFQSEFVYQFANFMYNIGLFLKKWNTDGEILMNFDLDSFIIPSKPGTPPKITGFDIAINTQEFKNGEIAYCIHTTSSLQWSKVGTGKLNDYQICAAIDMTGLLIAGLDMIQQQYNISWEKIELFETQPVEFVL